MTALLSLAGQTLTGSLRSGDTDIIVDLCTRRSKWLLTTVYITLRNIVLHVMYILQLYPVISWDTMLMVAGSIFLHFVLKEILMGHTVQ